jgi:large subunit ribosomal protein L21
MYAIIRSGGKQYRVQAGDVLKIEKLEQKPGDEVGISEVLFIGGEKPVIGAPYINGAKVQLVVTQQDLAAKILVFKKKRRKGYRKLRGHRQPFTEVFVKSISTPDGQVAKAEAKAHVIDPEKQAIKKAALFAKQEELRKAERASGETKKPVAKKAAPKKKAAAKKAAGKKKAGTKAKKKKTAVKAKKK